SILDSCASSRISLHGRRVGLLRSLRVGSGRGGCRCSSIISGCCRCCRGGGGCSDGRVISISSRRSVLHEGGRDARRARAVRSISSRQSVASLLSRESVLSRLTGMSNHSLGSLGSGCS
ncbi:hypothetical protein PMAYCL1PPCAC_09305, partial [Pristionchus mayeri]